MFSLLLLKASFKIKAALFSTLEVGKPKVSVSTHHKWGVAALAMQLCSGFLTPSPIPPTRRTSHTAEERGGGRGSQRVLRAQHRPAATAHWPQDRAVSCAASCLLPCPPTSPGAVTPSFFLFNNFQTRRKQLITEQLCVFINHEDVYYEQEEIILGNNSINMRYTSLWWDS